MYAYSVKYFFLGNLLIGKERATLNVLSREYQCVGLESTYYNALDNVFFHFPVCVRLKYTCMFDCNILVCLIEIYLFV